MRARSPVKSRDLTTEEDEEPAFSRPFEPSEPSSTQPDTGDVVLHRPTGERWVVAYVSGDKLAWCGWPSGVAKLSDCMLVERATRDERLKVLTELAAMSEADHRRTYARHTLAEEVLPAEY